MLKATIITTDGEPILVLGLTRENTTRLHDDKPIPVKVNDVDPRLPKLTILLVGGETEAANQADLIKHIHGRPD